MAAAAGEASLTLAPALLPLQSSRAPSLPIKHSRQQAPHIEQHCFSFCPAPASASSPPFPAMRFNLWDLSDTTNPFSFYHALHPSERCVYVYVWKPWDLPPASSPSAGAAAARAALSPWSLSSSEQFRSIISSIDEWLQLLQSHTPGSTALAPKITKKKPKL
jgi:hypothetical protein